MFRPVKLARVTIQAPETDIPAVMQVLGEMRMLHLINLQETHLGRVGYRASVDLGLLGRYQTVLHQVSRLLTALPPVQPARDQEKKYPGSSDASGDPGRDLRIDREVFRLEERVKTISEEVSPLVERIERVTGALSEHRTLVARLSLLEPSGIDFDRFSSLRYVCWHAGLVPRENIDRLEASLADIHHALVPVSTKEKRIALIAFALKEDEPVLMRALKSAFWDPLKFPPEVHGTASDVLKQLSGELSELEQSLQDLQEERERLAAQYGDELRTMRSRAELAVSLIRAASKFGQIDHTYIISAWIPVSLFDELRTRINQVTSGRAIVDITDPSDIREVRSGILKLPILFNNPVLIRPFERLVTMYGTPSYQEVEPTAFFAITFLLLFGMMFGDVGHGAVLCLAGWYIFRRMFRLMDYGIILMECGVSSMIFGVLYGSVFGVEDIIPALWMHPMSRIDYFMEMAAGVGVFMISAGLVFNIINVIRMRRYAELLSASGLAGALLYWLGVGLAVRWLLNGELDPHEVMLAKTAAGILVAIMIFQKPVRMLILRMRGQKVPGKVPEGLGVQFLESFIEVADDMLRFAGNTVSFVRVAAFALAHAGLFVAVFTLADMVREAHGSGLFYYLTIVGGNVVIIGLEGLVVSIQTIRLEYYEFFSKFFRGGGEAFKPLAAGDK